MPAFEKITKAKSPEAAGSPPKLFPCLPNRKSFLNCLTIDQQHHTALEAPSESLSKLAVLPAHRCAH